MRYCTTLSGKKPDRTSDGAIRREVTVKDLPIFEKMSAYELTLPERGLREPHWHTNADELGFCLEGEVVVSFYGNSDHRERFHLKEGEIFWIPSGFIHSISNVGSSQARLILAFNHGDPKEFGISTSMSVFSDEILARTWGVSPGAFKSLKRVKKDRFGAILPSKEKVEESEMFLSPYKFDLEGQTPLINYPFGSAKLAREASFPILKDHALYSLRLEVNGMREPHWHPKTVEMGFVAKGRARFSILNPEGELQFFEVGKGDLYYLPESYPHHIENIGGEELNILIFFNEQMPGDIAFSAGVRSFGKDQLAAAMGSDPKAFESLAPIFTDRFIVPTD